MHHFCLVVFIVSYTAAVEYMLLQSCAVSSADACHLIMH